MSRFNRAGGRANVRLGLPCDAPPTSRGQPRVVPFTSWTPRSFAGPIGFGVATGRQCIPLRGVKRVDTVLEDVDGRRVGEPAAEQSLLALLVAQIVELCGGCGNVGAGGLGSLDGTVTFGGGGGDVLVGDDEYGLEDVPPRRRCDARCARHWCRPIAWDWCLGHGGSAC